MKKPRVFTLGVACFFCAVIGLGVVPISLGGGVLGDNHAGLSVSAGVQNSAALNLNPATDETIFTTESGINIKSHKSSLGGVGVQYFTLGFYNNMPVNWLIVGLNDIGIGINSTPAGNAIKAETTNQKLITGAVSSDLLENQILCISEYAFNLSTYNAQFVANDSFTKTNMYYNTNLLAGHYGGTTNHWTYYYKSYNPLPDIAENTLSLGTILQINQFYGRGSGKIVVNTNFSSNYVFSLSTQNFTSFVLPTNYATPYLFNTPSIKTTMWTSDAVLNGEVTSYFGYSGYSPTHVTGSGAALAFVDNIINTNGKIGKSETLATFTATATDLSTYTKNDYGARCYDYKTTYSVTANNTLTISYRPAFVLQI